MGSREKDRDLERLIPAGGIGISDNLNGLNSESSSPSDSPIASSLSHHSGKEAFSKVIRSWASKKFMSGWLVLYYFVLIAHTITFYIICMPIQLKYLATGKANISVILFPLAITFYATWWFIHFVDGFFSPIYAHLGINIFGLGFVTSISFIFLVGVFMSSWLGASVLALGEWFIKKMPLMSYIYTASKQISAAISPDQNSHAFKEVAIVRHPRIGEYALGFITSTVILRKNSGAEELCCVYIPTNHLYLGEIFLINSKDVMRPNLSVREGIEIVISGGMSIPKVLTIVDSTSILSPRVGKFAIPQV